MIFRCIEPFRKWIVSYDGQAYEGSVQKQIAREFGVYADGPPCSYPRKPLAYEVELTMVTPAWVQDYRPEKLAGMSAQEKADAGSMGYGYRIEHLFRGEGTLTIDGATRQFKAVGSRIHRQSVQPMAAFRGHCWQSASFPRWAGLRLYRLSAASGRGARRIATTSATFTSMVRCTRPERPRFAFLRKIMPRGVTFHIELGSESGPQRRSGSTTELCTFHLGNPGGERLQQSAERGALHAGRNDRLRHSRTLTRPPELCTIVG